MFKNYENITIPYGFQIFQYTYLVDDDDRRKANESYYLEFRIHFCKTTYHFFGNMMKIPVFSNQISVGLN